MVAWESEAIELHAGFCCRGLGIASGSRWVAGTNEKKGERTLQRERGSGIVLHLQVMLTSMDLSMG